jgi:hypothetical protein
LTAIICPTDIKGDGFAPSCPRDLDYGEILEIPIYRWVKLFELQLPIGPSEVAE